MVTCYSKSTRELYPDVRHPSGLTVLLVLPRELYPVFRKDFGYLVKSRGKQALILCDFTLINIT
jgi:hypothetical protein